MFVLSFERLVSVDPEAAFSLISDPDLMNRWSEAHIEPVARGDGGHHAGVGALRRVHAQIAGMTSVLEEVIERSIPGRELRYRVYAPATVRHHVGVITIDPTPQGARVRWKVEIDLGSVPLEWIVRRALEPSLVRSLDRMSRLSAEGAPLVPLPPIRTLSEIEDARAARPLAEACLRSQQARADALLGKNDDRGWFAKVYSHVTEGQLRACSEGRFDHPAWVLRLVHEFHRLWDDNLARRLGELDGEVESHWARAHRVAERGAEHGSNMFLRAMRAIAAGMKAHIEHDLARAIAKVHLDHYRGRSDLARFRGDYLRMSDLFVAAGARIQAVLPRQSWTARARVLDAITPASWRADLIDRSYYPITRNRREAFERAEAIVRALAST